MHPSNYFLLSLTIESALSLFPIKTCYLYIFLTKYKEPYSFVIMHLYIGSYFSCTACSFCFLIFALVRWKPVLTKLSVWYSWSVCSMKFSSFNSPSLLATCLSRSKTKLEFRIVTFRKFVLSVSSLLWRSSLPFYLKWFSL